MVATKCEHKPLEYPVPEIKTVCEEAIDVASNVVKVVVAGNIKDRDHEKFPKVAECIKTRTIEKVKEETKICMIEVLNEAFVDAS